MNKQTTEQLHKLKMPNWSQMESTKSTTNKYKCTRTLQKRQSHCQISFITQIRTEISGVFNVRNMKSDFVRNAHSHILKHTAKKAQPNIYCSRAYNVWIYVERTYIFLDQVADFGRCDSFKIEQLSNDAVFLAITQSTLRLFRINWHFILDCMNFWA